MLAFSLMLCCAAWAAEEDVPSEYTIKAAMILKFAGFVTWPAESFESPSDPLVLGILGDDPFGSRLEEILQDVLVDGRRIVVQRARDEQHLSSCHILFVSRSEDARVGEIIDRVRGRAVLTVGEAEGFCERGGIVNFYHEEQRIRFQINPGVADREDLKISSQLLKLARIVTDASQKKGA